MKRLVSTALVTAFGAAVLAVPASAATTDGVPTTDFSVTATGPERATPGETVEYVVTVTNKGPAAAPVMVNATLPKGSSAITYASRPVTGRLIMLNTFNPGEIRTLKITAKIGSHGGEMALPAGFGVHRGYPNHPFFNESNYGDNYAYVDTVNEKGDPFQGPDARLGFTGEIGAGDQEGDLVTQRLTFTNTGRHRTSVLELSGRVYPGSGTIVGVTGLEDARGVTSSVGLQYTVPALDPGKTRVVTITTKITPSAGGIGGRYFVGAAKGGDQELDLRR
ncbi:hypothetical protein [Streptomyces sp. NPDC059816]|uniref:hypothetical protein n=1 Tax=Streptomyces sp. NPDC059816 TaxID=3346960 RepID=UPI0036461D66